MPNAPSRLELRALREQFLRLETTTQLCALFNEDPLELSSLALEPAYEEFEVLKRNGEPRLIENPVPALKRFQRKLNEALQAVYYFERSPAAYGFLTACADDEAWQHRNIVSNARQHLGRPWLLNMDVEDFFHYIGAERVALVFLSPPFRFVEETAALLMRLCTYKGRLPMGAPSSPIITNFATRLLDQDLLTLARSRQWAYTRYADDMSFSSKDEITAEDIELLRQYYRAHGFEPNEQKTKLMGPKDEHSVTGIVIRENQLDLPQQFFEELHIEINRLAEIANTKGRLGITLKDWVEDYADKIEGMIAFAEYVLGKNEPRVQKAERALEKAKSGPKAFGAVSWLDFPYH